MYSFADGFDCYAAIADIGNGYWDSFAGTGNLLGGRFSGSQSIRLGSSTTVLCAKSSGQNDAVHHIVVAFMQTGAISGTNLACYLQLLDGTTGQCAIVFRTDGAIVFTSGTATGTAPIHGTHSSSRLPSITRLVASRFARTVIRATISALPV
jgi:hypothetical protein